MKYTEAEAELLKRHTKNGRIQTLPRKPSKQKILLQVLIRDFENGNIYNEQEVNSILMRWYDDYVVLRRSLVDAKLLVREDDGSSYVVNIDLYKEA